MKRISVFVVVTAVVCAFVLLGLTACGGSGSSGGSSSGGSQEKSEPVPTDEELIQADIEKIIGTVISSDELLAQLREDETMKQFEGMGLDLESYAENMAKKFKLEVDAVEVSGDTAVVKAKLTTPTFGDEANEIMEKALAKASEGLDLSTMSQSEQMKVFAEALNAALTDPDFPTNSSDFDIDYVKKDGTWEAKDKDKLSSLLDSVGSTAAGLNE